MSSHNTITDYELIELLATYADSTGDHFMNFVTVLFAFLVAIYFAVDKISKTMRVVLVFLYTAFSAIVFGAVVHATLWYLEIGSELARRGHDLTNHISYYPAEILAGGSGIFMVALVWLAYVTAYIAGLVFLREARKM